MSRTAEQIEYLKRKVNSQTWWHTISLGDGIVTPGVEVQYALKESYLHLDRIDFNNVPVLDIGASDGKYSFYAESHGAMLVESIEFDERANRCYNIARMALDSTRCVRRYGDFLKMRMDPLFGIVLFLGILYHLQDPMAGLQQSVRALRPGGLLLLETAIEPGDVGFPFMRFTRTYHPDDGGMDTTNWWYPSKECVGEMLLAVGLDPIEYIGGVETRGAWRAIKPE